MGDNFIFQPGGGPQTVFTADNVHGGSISGSLSGLNAGSDRLGDDGQYPGTHCLSDRVAPGNPIRQLRTVGEHTVNILNGNFRTFPIL